MTTPPWWREKVLVYYYFLISLLGMITNYLKLVEGTTGCVGRSIVIYELSKGLIAEGNMMLVFTVHLRSNSH